ncbi:Glycerophosphoryl diester phosphodiesterase family-domain-containing protein [Xylariales sp. PMI_506]|nr:Glycerophosphoryl diester phosphodiesterase family-domain-containing protein [Xylariales sp. PMI_506]
MKFGCAFQRLQNLQWTNAYIDYDGLKRLLQHSPLSRDHVNHFENALLREIGDVNAFLLEQCKLVDLWIVAILNRFSIRGTEEPSHKEFAQVIPAELEYIYSCLLEVFGFASDVAAFARLNRDAVQRLYEKIGSTAIGPSSAPKSEGPLYAQPWIKTASRLENLLVLVTEARKVHVEEVCGLSLLLKRVQPTTLGCSREEVCQSILGDDPAALMCVMASPAPYMENQVMLHSVLQLAIVCRAQRCIQSLLEEIIAPVEEVDGGHHDALHQLIAQVGQSAAHDRKSGPAEVDLLEHTFRELSPYQHHMLVVRDWRHRYPLHYAAQYGLSTICSEISKFMEPLAALDPDISGQSALELAVFSGQVEAVKSLLESHDLHSMVSNSSAGSLLVAAIQGGFIDTAKYLVKLERGLNYRGEHGQTPLYHAARYGQTDVVVALLTTSVVIDLDCTEDSRGWSPLIVACVFGHLEVARLLLEAGAVTSTQDWKGWTAVVHAAYRAHMAIVDLLQRSLPSFTIDYAPLPSESPPMAPLKEKLCPTSSHIEIETPVIINTLTTVYVNLGSFDVRPEVPGVVLEPGLLYTSDEHRIKQNQMLLEVSAQPCQEKPYTIRLPYLGDLSELTLRFSTPDLPATKLVFKLLECTGDNQQTRRLRGMAMTSLDSIRGWFRSERQSLRRDTTVALATPDGCYAGLVNFTFLVCRPYNHPKAGKVIQKMRQLDLTQVVGHRGLGWNDPADAKPTRIQIGEHTIQSLESAMAHGADLVEDVQITRDRVPVIYHDWHVSETGLDVPIHAMTFHQWMAISNEQSQEHHHEAPKRRLPWDERARPAEPPRRRSKSLCAHSNHHPGKAVQERLKHTVEYARNHMKGNIRGNCIHEKFVTLRQIFEQIPEHVCFDIELKYPMFWECEYWEMEPYWIEMNEYIDATLDVVFELAGSRPVFFTCFNPEVCALLSTKQRAYPVVFLNDSMASGPAGDARATSLQRALRFARQWDLQGVVMAAEAFVAAPGLVRHVRNQGLVCGSYGSLNDIPEYAQKQAAEGIDMLVVNSVRLISNTLQNMQI